VMTMVCRESGFRRIRDIDALLDPGPTSRPERQLLLADLRLLWSSTGSATRLRLHRRWGQPKLRQDHHRPVQSRADRVLRVLEAVEFDSQ
jgi:hypothetical protein